MVASINDMSQQSSLTFRSASTLLSMKRTKHARGTYRLSAEEDPISSWL